MTPEAGREPRIAPEPPADERAMPPAQDPVTPGTPVPAATSDPAPDTTAENPVISARAVAEGACEQRPKRPFTAGQLILLALLGGIAPLGTDIYLASVPHVATALDTSTAAVQFTLTGFMVGLAVGPLVIGPISDRRGRYRLLVGGVFALLASSVLCALAPSIGILIAARVVQGLSGSIAMTLCRALVADVVSGVAAARIYSLLSTIMGVSPIVAPILGGLIQQWASWRLAFWVIAAISAALAAGVLTLLHETLPPERRHAGGFMTTMRGAANVIRDRQFLSFTCAMGFTSGALFSYISASPFVIQEILGFQPLAYSLIFAVNAVGLTAAAGLSTAIVARVGPARLTQVGAMTILCGALGLATAALTGTLEAWLLLPAMFLVPTGAGFLFGNGTAMAMQRVGYAAGSAQAILGFAQFGMSGTVAPLVSLAGPRSIVPLAVIVTICAAVVTTAVSIGARVSKEGGSPFA